MKQDYTEDAEFAEKSKAVEGFLDYAARRAKRRRDKENRAAPLGMTVLGVAGGNGEFEVNLRLRFFGPESEGLRMTSSRFGGEGRITVHRWHMKLQKRRQAAALQICESQDAEIATGMERLREV